jgi:hypothetical protein
MSTIGKKTATCPCKLVVIRHCNSLGGFIVVVKKTLRYSNVFFYNHLYPNSVIRNIMMESGINARKPRTLHKNLPYILGYRIPVCPAHYRYKVG